VALSKDQIPRLASIVRSLMLTGRTLTTYLVHSFDYDSRVKSILEMSDTIVFDSLSLDVAKWYECNSFRSIEKLVDVQWLRLSGWREHVKLSFEAPHAYQRLHDLAALEVTMGETPGALLNAWLLVHWLLAHLDLTLGDKRDGVIELRGAQHRQAELRLTKKSSNYNALPSRCAMNFLGPQKTSVVLESLIGEIRTEFSDQENLVVTSRFDDLSPDQLVCRFFEAGETINEYRRYLARALSSVRELGA
ncbi:MAG: glucose-6-phosphate dehydrogenase assembly protein OpcA, partial [Bdellovibrionales bacterium]|nr:glucose-6-phosphate dehydrogenase assembly protein OpcA [Bdellovibrionales bacterium]